jgi:hypothetical protein
MKVGDEVYLEQYYHGSMSWEIRPIKKITATLFVVDCGNYERRFYRESRYSFNDATKQFPFYSERAAHSYGVHYTMYPIADYSNAKYQKWKRTNDRFNLINQIRKVKVRADISNERLQEIYDELCSPVSGQG